MKQSSATPVIAICVAGLLAGLAGRRIVSSRSSVPVSVIEAASVRTNAAPAAVETPHVRSTDTVETLAALAPGTLYSRLALWLMDASEQDIAAFWAIYQKGEPDENITGLIFLRWACHNSQAAIAAEPAGHDKKSGWWAWACHDPQAALAAADETQIKSVAQGIGEFHPAWLRQHFKELSEEGQAAALEGMKGWEDADKPLESLQFLTANGGYFEDGFSTLKALARQDPWAALDWVKNNAHDDDPYGFSQRMASVIDTLAKERPEDLKRIAAQAPSGTFKLEMEAALFGNLIKSDPAGALQQARSTQAPRIAAERYAAIGNTVIQRDPEQAFQLAKDLFSICPDALDLADRLEISNYATRYPSEIRTPEIDAFVGSLIEKDPAKLMDIVVRMSSDPIYTMAMSPLPIGWAEHDLGAFTAWLNQQPDQNIRGSGVGIISGELQKNGHFQEAAEWELSRLIDGTLDSDMEVCLRRWMESDSQAPTRWLESADLPIDRKGKIQAIIDRLK